MALHPRHCTIVALDIENYSGRPEHVQSSLREAMFNVTETAARESQINWDECEALERGDSIILLVPPTVTPVVLPTVFMERLDGALCQEAMVRSALAAIRFRVAVHSGYVSTDRHGHVGNAINDTCRLLDAGPLRHLLATTPGIRMAVIMSDDLHGAIVAQGHGGIDPDRYVPVRVTVKAYDQRAWLSVPGRPATPVPPQARWTDPAPPPADTARPTAAPAEPGGVTWNIGSVGGNVIARDSYTVNLSGPA